MAIVLFGCISTPEISNLTAWVRQYGINVSREWQNVLPARMFSVPFYTVHENKTATQNFLSSVHLSQASEQSKEEIKGKMESTVGMQKHLASEVHAHCGHFGMEGEHLTWFLLLKSKKGVNLWKKEEETKFFFFVDVQFGNWICTRNSWLARVTWLGTWKYFLSLAWNCQILLGQGSVSLNESWTQFFVYFGSADLVGLICCAKLGEVTSTSSMFFRTLNQKLALLSTHAPRKSVFVPFNCYSESRRKVGQERKTGNFRLRVAQSWGMFTCIRRHRRLLFDSYFIQWNKQDLPLTYTNLVGESPSWSISWNRQRFLTMNFRWKFTEEKQTNWCKLQRNSSAPTWKSCQNYLSAPCKISKFQGNWILMKRCFRSCEISKNVCLSQFNRIWFLFRNVFLTQFEDSENLEDTSKLEVDFSKLATNSDGLRPGDESALHKSELGGAVAILQQLHQLAKKWKQKKSPAGWVFLLPWNRSSNGRSSLNADLTCNLETNAATGGSQNARKQRKLFSHWRRTCWRRPFWQLFQLQRRQFRGKYWRFLSDLPGINGIRLNVAKFLPSVASHDCIYCTFQEYLQLGPLELKLLSVSGKKVSLARPRKFDLKQELFSKGTKLHIPT